MPELPEVECVRRSLAPHLVGRTIARTRVTLPKLARPHPKTLRQGLAGRTITDTQRHGKLLILPLSGGAFWTIHLGMTGQLICSPRRPNAKHIHITISFQDHGPRLYFRDLRQFGFMAFCPDLSSLQTGSLASFGPDALKISPQELAQRLAPRRAPIKTLLLNQHILAGVGNIYADEALFRARISPLTRPIDLHPQQLLQLHQAIQQTLHEAIARGGSSVRNFVDARGRAGTFQHQHNVYRRTGQPCPRCQTPISRITLGGRSTHFCPHCQPRIAGGGSPRM